MLPILALAGAPGTTSALRTCFHLPINGLHHSPWSAAIIFSYSDTKTLWQPPLGSPTTLLGEEFRFAASRHTVVVANYRFLVVDYVTLPQDSITNFFLAGVEQTFNSRLQAQLRGGVSFRSIEGGQDQANPDVEGSLTYALGKQSSIAWTGRYGVEAQSTGLQNTTEPTFRTGLQFHYAITPRISSTLGFNYHENQNQPQTIITPGANLVAANAYDVLLNFRYQINRHFDCDAGYQRSGASSADPNQDSP